MSRVGLHAGASTTTALWLPFRDGETIDRSQYAQTMASVGTAPTRVDGPTRDALSFTAGYLTATDSGAGRLDGSGSQAQMSVECWFYSLDPNSSRPLFARRAGATPSWCLYASATTATFTVYDNGGTPDSVTLPVARAFPGVYRWHHIRAVFLYSDKLAIYLDGQLVAYKTTTLASLRASTIGALQIGGEVSSYATDQWSGYITDVRMAMALGGNTLDATETGSTILAVSTPKRLTRRQYKAWEVDLVEECSDDSWTSDGAGGFWLALSSLTIGASVMKHEDVRSVVSVTGSTATTYAEVGNVTDLDAASNSYFVDTVNRRIYSSENPASADLFKVTIRVRLADRTLLRGHHTYWPAVLNSDAGEQRMPYWNQAYPTGGGGRLEIAAQHPNIPDGIVSEEGTGVIWTNAPVTCRMLSDGMAWSQGIVLAGGIIDTQPDDGRDTISATVLHEAAKLHRVPFEEQVANLATWPRIETNGIGHAWPSIWGRGHQRVKSIVVDTRPTTIASQSMWRRKWANQPCCSIDAIGSGVTRFTAASFYNVDLSVSEFYSPHEPDVDIWVDCSGYGTPSSPTSTPGTALTNFGNPADAIVAVHSQLQKWLELYIGASSASIGTTFAARGADIGLRLRRNEPLQGAGAVVKMIHGLTTETLATPYYVPSTGLWEWEDVVKADAVEWTIRDADVITEQWIVDRSNIAKRANAQAHDYAWDASGVLHKGVDTTLALNAVNKYGVREVWEPGAGILTGIPTATDTDAWLARITPLLQSPSFFYDVTVPHRFATIQQFAVVSVQVTSRPTSAGARFRVLSAHHVEAGVKLVLFSETLFPSSGAVTEAYREALAHVPRVNWGAEYPFGPTTISTGGAWQVWHGNAGHLFQGTFTFPPSITHRFAVHGQRTGGAADSDFQLRLWNKTNSAQLAIVSIPTSAGFVASTSFSNIPATDARIEVQAKTDNGATGILNAAAWTSAEGASNALADALAPMTLFSWYSDVGIGFSQPSPIVGWMSTPMPMGAIQFTAFPPGTKLRWCIYADPGSATGVYLRLSQPAFQFVAGPKVILTFPAITSAGFYADPTIPVMPEQWVIFQMEFTATNNATVTIYGLSVEAVFPDRVV